VLAEVKKVFGALADDYVIINGSRMNKGKDDIEYFKSSYHIVFQDIIADDNRDFKVFAQYLNKIEAWVDTGIYSKNRSMRCAFNCKADDTEPLVFSGYAMDRVSLLENKDAIMVLLEKSVICVPKQAQTFFSEETWKGVTDNVEAVKVKGTKRKRTTYKPTGKAVGRPRRSLNPELDAVILGWLHEIPGYEGVTSRGSTKKGTYIFDTVNSRPCLFTGCDETHDQGFCIIDSGHRGTVFKMRQYGNSHKCSETTMPIFVGKTHVPQRVKMLNPLLYTK
jgi:hypothetical protein